MDIDMIVEIPQGSRNKYEMDHEAGQIRLDRMLFTAARYPLDYGFVPVTLAEEEIEPGEDTDVRGWQGRAAAELVVKESRARASHP